MVGVCLCRKATKRPRSLAGRRRRTRLYYCNRAIGRLAQRRAGVRAVALCASREPANRANRYLTLSRCQRLSQGVGARETFRSAGVAGWRIPLQNGQEARAFFSGASSTSMCGPTQLNIHFEGVSDHGDKHDLVFSGLSTFLKRRVDSFDTVQRHC
jgi:hypothetical protein